MDGLLGHVAKVYAGAQGDSLGNDKLYREVAERAGIEAADVDRRTPIGRAKALRSVVKRRIRWQQQTLKALGILERVPGDRGAWRLTAAGRAKLTPAPARLAIVVFSTDLGIAIWGNAEDISGRLDQPIALYLSSPPYPLRRARAYGNAAPEHEYVDFICKALEPIVENLVQGGSVCLNLSQDIFLEGSPARSLYLERLSIALHDRLGLDLMDRIVWENPSKPPGPTQWASIKRVQLNVGYEPVLWFTNCPKHVRADNRRVLLPHTERHRKLIESGGERRVASFADGAYRIRPGDFGRPTPGRIPKNVITKAHNCADQRHCRMAARQLGLPIHGATMPLEIADFLVRFLTRPGDLVVDDRAGTLTTAKAAEINGRRWIAVERMLEYVRAGAERFREANGFRLNPETNRLLGIV